MPWLFFLFGLASLTGQVLLLREILAIYYGAEITIGVFYGAWLSGIGCGALAGTVAVKRLKIDFHALFIYSLLLLGVSILLEILLIRNLPRLLGVAPAELAPLHGIVSAIPIGTILVSFLTGFLFPVGLKALPDADDAIIARLYVFEALGSLAGGMLFTFVLVRLFTPVGTAVLALLAVSSGALSHGRMMRRRDLTAAAMIVMGCGFYILMGAAVKLSGWSVEARWQALHPGLELIDIRPTPYQQAEIARLGKQYSFYGNGKIVSSFPDPHTTDRTAALIMAQRPQAKKILVIGGATGGLIRSLSAYPVREMDVVEPDGWAFELVKKYLPSAEAGALEDTRTRMIFSDGRLYVNHMGTKNYDVIVALLPDPVSAFWNRYYTLEFFQAAAKGLAPGGILVTGVTSADNFWGAETASYAGSVFHTLKQVFPTVEATPGDETLFFAAKAPGAITLDPTRLADQYAGVGVESFDPTAFKTLLPPNKTEFVRKELARSPKLLNTDFTPISSSLAMMLWGKFSGTAGLEILNTVRRAGLLLYIIPLGLFVAARLLFRIRWGDRDGREKRFQALFAMAATGACAMGLQIALMYAYQSMFGYVFERVGLFAALFMAGLAGGGLIGRRALERAQGGLTPLTLPMIGLAAACLAFRPLLSVLSGVDSRIAEIIVFAVVTASGALTGAAFPLAASAHFRVSRNAGEASGWIDATDHLGAAVGGMITGTLLVPLLGMGKAGVVLALVVSTSVLLIFADRFLSSLDQLLKQMRPHGPYSFPFAAASWLLMWLVAAALVWSIVIGPPERQYTVKFGDSTLIKVSGSDTFTYKEEPFPHYIGHGKTPEKTFSLSSIPPARQVRGYGGPLNLLTSVDDKGVIQGIKLLESDETRSYIEGLDTWLSRFKGRSILEKPGAEIDAISKATITCEAVKETLRVTGAKIGHPILGIEPSINAAKTASRWRSALTDHRLWLILFVFTLAVIAFHSRRRKLRLISLGASFVVIGVYLNALFTSLDVASLLQLRIPAVDTPWRALFIVGALLVSLLWGQVFCGFMCPFGALQEMIAIKRLRQRASPRVEQAGRFVKFAILSLLVSLFLVTGDTIWFSFSPLQSFFSFKMGAWVIALSIIVLAASIFYFRFWCRYLCPAGSFLALFNKVALLKRFAPKPMPARCDLGVSFPDDVDCIRCHRCLYGE
jgi:predicted membrane-bound spermidine synthase